jgi:hypothetical protein
MSSFQAQYSFVRDRKRPAYQSCDKTHANIAYRNEITSEAYKYLVARASGYSLFSWCRCKKRQVVYAQKWGYSQAIVWVGKKAGFSEGRRGTK